MVIRVRVPGFEPGISPPQGEVLTTILHTPGEAGYRSLYLSHAKRALYHLSYIPGYYTHTPSDFKIQITHAPRTLSRSRPHRTHPVTVPRLSWPMRAPKRTAQPSLGPNALARPRLLPTPAQLSLVIKAAADTRTTPAESLHQLQHVSESSWTDHRGRRIDPVSDLADCFCTCLTRRGPFGRSSADGGRCRRRPTMSRRVPQSHDAIPDLAGGSGRGTRIRVCISAECW